MIPLWLQLALLALLGVLPGAFWIARVRRRPPVDLAAPAFAEDVALATAQEALRADYAQVQTQITAAVQGDNPEDALAARFTAQRGGRP